MRKRALLACLVAMVMVLSSCALVEKDLAVDNASVIIELGDKTVTKAQVSSMLEYQLYYQSVMYSMYGMSYDTTDKQIRASALESVLQYMTENLVKEAKAEALGFNVITEEEDKAIKETAQKDFDSAKESVKTSEFAESTLEGEELDKAIVARMAEVGQTYEAYYESAKSEAIMEKLRQSVIADVSVSDDEIKTEYDSRVASAKTSYESNLSSYGSSVNSNGTVYYAPAGYRYVKHILRGFTEESKTAISDLNSKITGKTSEITSVDTSIAGLGADVAADNPDLVSFNAQKATLEKEKADLEAQLAQAKEKAYAELMPTVEEIQGKLTAGEDFSALMEQYGEDPGMEVSPQKENGYAICEGFSSFDPAFTQAAMALEKLGDVTAPVQGENGIHIIQYAADIPEGPVALETVKDTISSELLTNKQDETFTAQVTAWVAESGVKVHKELLDE